MPKISIVSPAHNEGKYIRKFIESILDQDFKDWSLTLVDDGSKDNTKVIIEEFVTKYPEKIKGIYFDENRGACTARNEGAKIATGEYLSFLPSDAVLYPGMLRIWVEKLDQNPEYDFLYGGYQFTDDNGNVIQDYISQSFDPYMLEVNNYIDGSFPLRRTLYDKIGGWDPMIKSLQDWDFWLTAVKQHKAKGLYVADLFFGTIMPHPGGLSYDSANNWTERTNQIKAKQGIEKRDICVCSPGAPFHGINVAKMLNADYKDNPSFKPHEYKCIYVVGAYYSLFPNIVDAFKKHDGLRILHWIGSDIFQLQQLRNDGRTMSRIALNTFLEYLSNNVDVHLAEYGQTVKELKEFGIKAREVPLPPKNIYEVAPLPEKFAVAVYLPYTNKDFYYPQVCQELAQKMPDVIFKFFGDSTIIGHKGNVHFMGKIEPDKMGDFIKDCSAILRLTPHDGLPLSVCEFITAGRNAITTTPMSYVLVPKDLKIETLVQAVEECKKLGVNKQGSEYYRGILDQEKFAKEIKGFMKYDPKKYWSERALLWDKMHTNLPDEQYTEIVDKYITKVKELSGKSSIEILDVGCGNGNWSEWLGLRGKYIGLDICKKLIKIAKKKHPAYKYIESDLIHYGGKTDLAFTFTALLHVKPEELEKYANHLKKISNYGIFVEPCIKADKNLIGERKLPAETVKAITQKGKNIAGIESSFVHLYEKHFNILESVKIGARQVMLVKMKEERDLMGYNSLPIH